MDWMQDSMALWKKASNLLWDAFELWMEHNESKMLAPTTLRNYREFVEPFVNFLSQHITRPDEASPLLIRQWLIHKRREGVNPATLRNYYRMPAMFWRWCVREGLASVNPFEQVDAPRAPKTVKPALTKEEVDAIFRACQGTDWKQCRNRAFVSLLLDTGLRLHEALSLTVADGQQERVVIRGKGGKQRAVFLSHDVRLNIRRYLMRCPYKLAPDAPLWWTERGAMTRNGAQRILAAIGRKAGLKRRLSPHAFRRTFASWSLRNGVDLERLRLLMGHSDFTVLRSYLELTEADLRDAHRQYSPLNALQLLSRKPRE